MTPAAIAGARNLLVNCAGVEEGDQLLILHEDPALGWYDVETPRLIAHVAEGLGVRVQLRQCGGPDNILLEQDPGRAAQVDDDCDCCIFLARIGDQLRFESDTQRRRVMCYAGSVEALASAYGGIAHDAMLEIKAAIDSVIVQADSISITCPLGSDLRGTIAGAVNEPPQDVTVRRFPVGVHAPIDAEAFSGTVRVARYLTPTGSRVYAPRWVGIDTPVSAEVERGSIVRFTGDAADVRRVEGQYRQVAKEFGIRPDVVHSWHAGIHPGCHFDGLAADDPDRWSNTVFTSPRFAHFHTCGNVAPGEICWMVLDPTICVDEVPLWDGGRLQPERFALTRQCLEDWPVLRDLFDVGNGAIGLH